MSYEYSEDGLVEAATQETLEALGWTVTTAWHKETFSTSAYHRNDSLLGRINKSETLLIRDLSQALQTLNPDLPQTAYQQATDSLSAAIADKRLAEINQQKHQLLTDGVEVSYQDEKGVLQKKRLKVFDFKTPTNNHFRAVRQLEVVGRLYNRRPDVVGFVNGIPLVFFELKAHHTDLRHAYDDNLSDYKDTIPALLHCCTATLLSSSAMVPMHG